MVIANVEGFVAKAIQVVIRNLKAVNTVAMNQEAVNLDVIDQEDDTNWAVINLQLLYDLWNKTGVNDTFGQLRH
jgi:hypothetical protein